MTTYPLTPRADFIRWCAAHEAAFTDKPETIGLSPAQAADYAIRLKAAKDALVEQEQARQAALVATQIAEDAVAALRAATGSAVRTIRAFAEATDDPTVYNEAQIAPPAHRSPAPPPAKSTRLDATLEPATGALTLRWHAAQPAGTGGTSYLVRRRLPGEAVFSFVGVAVKKTFVDDSLPGGVAQAEYTVQAQRGSRSGPPSAILLVYFGGGTGKSQNVEKSKSQNLSLGRIAGGGLNSELRRANGEMAGVNGATGFYAGDVWLAHGGLRGPVRGGHVPVGPMTG